MATFTDDFNRADADIGANYTSRQGSFQVLSNTFKGFGANSYCEVATTAADFTDNHFSQFTVTAVGNDDYLGPAVRVSAAGCYAIKTDGRNLAGSRIIKMTTTTLAVLGTVNITVVANDVLKLTAVGDQIKAYKNGTLIDTVTDTSFTTGQPGLWYDRSNINASRGDTFSAEDLISITSVDSDNEIYSTQADFNVIGAGFSAGQSFYISTTLCTELSFSGATSVKLTAPNLTTANIKFGKQTFRVTD